MKSVRKFYYFLTNKLLFIPYEVLCHCEAPPIMGTPKDTLYFWGKGVCKHNTGDCRLRRLTGQKRSIRRVAISRKGILVIIPRKILSYLRGEKAQTAYYFVFIIYNYFYYYISKKNFENVCFLLYKTFFIWYYPFITLYYAKLLTR